MKEIYLDNSATTKPLPEVVEKITNTLTQKYGNPSSLHDKGLEAEKIVKKTRRLLAKYLNVNENNICFTSGGTESNNLAIRGTAYNYRKRGLHVITSSIEHSSVLESFIALEEEGFEVTYLNTDRYGNISPEEVKNNIREDTILVSIHHINNELGTIEPINKIGKIIKEKNENTLFHVDAVQSLGKVYLQPVSFLIDLLSISGHKIHGPKGIGALFVNDGINLIPFLIGGGQENNLRGGTENVPGIAGLGAAVEALNSYTTENNYDRNINELKQFFIKKINTYYPDVVINTPETSSPHIISTAFPGVKGEVLVHSLAKKGIYVSTGSACHSRNREKSHVLRTIGLDKKLIEGTIRISLSRFNTKKELDYTAKQIKEQINKFF
ncbi:MAG: cysteine desulfurase family protein [Halanaerobiales bacterium]